MAEVDVATGTIEQAGVHVGARVRLRAPSPLVELRSDTGTVLRPDVWDGYYIVRLDAPARLQHDGHVEEVSEIAEAADNLDPLWESEPTPLTALAFFPCDRVDADEDGRVLVHPSAGGESQGFPARVTVTLYGRFVGEPRAQAIDVVLVSLDSGEERVLDRAGIEIEHPDQVVDLAFPVEVSFPRAGRYAFELRVGGRLIVRHPWVARQTAVPAR
jgi:hypothetical protein